MPNILFNFFIIFATNCSSLSDTILSGNLCNFYILSLNSYTNPSANVPSVVATKYVILDNLSQTTRITSFPATISNFVIKSTIKCVYNFSGTLLNFNFSISISILFFIFWHILHPSIYFPTSLVTSNHQ